MSLTCEQAAGLLTDLLAGEIAAASAETLDDHLADCANCRVQAAQAIKLNRALAELSAQQLQAATLAKIADSLPGSRPAPARRRQPTIAWLAGAGVLALVGLVLVGAGLLWNTNRAVPGIAWLDVVEGEVRVHADGGVIQAAAGHPLRRGDQIETVGEASRAIFHFHDQTRVEVGPDSKIAGISNGTKDVGKHISLMAGYLRADVARQPAGRPMILDTPHATVVVRGTTLSLVNSPEATRVDLEEGKIEVTRRSDGEKMEMAAGSYSIVRPGPETIAPRPLPPLITQARLTLLEPSHRTLALAFSPDGRTLASGGQDGAFHLWDPSGAADQAGTRIMAHAKGEVHALAYRPDGLALATGGHDDFTTRIWNLAEGSVGTTLKGLRTWVEALAYTRDGRTIIVAGAHGMDSSRVKVWDLVDFRVLHTLQAHAQGVWSVALTPDEQLLVTGGRDRTAKVFGMATGQLLHTLEGHTGEVLSVAVSPDGRTIATSSRDKTIKLWDVATGQEKATLLGHTHDVRAVAFTQDGRTLLSGSADGTARVWDLADYRERAIFRTGVSIWCMALSPDGRTLAVAGLSKWIKLLDLP